VKLNGWEAIPLDQRKKTIIQWYKNDKWDIYQGMAGEAAVALREKMLPISDITGVEVCAENLNSSDSGYVPELVLNVCTLLSESNNLEQSLPNFADFGCDN